MRTCLECSEKLVGREDKSFVQTIAEMPTTIKLIKTATISCEM